MGLLDYFKQTKENGVTAEELFRAEKEADSKINECSDCLQKHICKIKDTDSKEEYLCKFVKKIEDYDPTKSSILIIDDNMGVISFLEDDFLELDEEKIINLSNYNILKFSTQYAGFELQAALKLYDGLNIEYAIFDITLGGGVYDEQKGNIILDGVDSFINVHSFNRKLKYVFFTGNKLNPYIKKNDIIIKKYKAYTGEDIQKHLLYKTSLAPEQRKYWLADFITGKKHG